MSYIDELGKKAKAASGECATLTEIKKNEILKEISDLLLASKEEIIAENKKDIENAHKNNMTKALID